MTPLTTEGLIEELHRFRSEKLALVALIGSMGAGDERDALRRLREIIAISDQQRQRLRRGRRKGGPEFALWNDVYTLAREIEPWLTQVVERA